MALAEGVVFRGQKHIIGGGEQKEKTKTTVLHREGEGDIQPREPGVVCVGMKGGGYFTDERGIAGGLL